ncbi:uncharacterized protein LOC143282269 [Babylonia areolata]|uniref:uncharacterized protein LOC143282269 n=1 Tax=Babylonia areolata TaxID=304850 RepID=UPI003FD435F4
MVMSQEARETGGVSAGGLRVAEGWWGCWDEQGEITTWIRHPDNCSRYLACSGGQAREMTPCGEGHVFSVRDKHCVAVGSSLDDCEEPSFDVHAQLPFLNSSFWNRLRLPDTEGWSLGQPVLSQSEAVTAEDWLVPLSSVDVQQSGLPVPVPEEVCGSAQSVFPHPGNCAWYFNCSLLPDAVMETYHGDHVVECPYPQLFSSVSLQCEDFADVLCQSRSEPKSPCDYRANHCQETSHCIPCWVRYASCVTLPDGLNPWPGLYWQPFFVECYRQRTLFQGSCNTPSIFSPLTRTCETPHNIPREYGGWRSSCRGRRNGKFPDENGRCESYYTCKDQVFTGFHSCPADSLFNPVSGRCQGRSEVPYPCGDQDTQNFCRAKPDGRYLDAYGRCTHYYSCLGGVVGEVSLCPDGVFNPQTRHCDTSSDVTSPCGRGHNPCVEKEDGYHADHGVATSCGQYYLCERGLQIAVFSCHLGQTFDDVSGTCVDVMESAAPCGSLPSCDREADGRYPTSHEGVRGFYECHNWTSAGYSHCVSIMARETTSSAYLFGSARIFGVSQTVAAGASKYLWDVGFHRE